MPRQLSQSVRAARMEADAIDVSGTVPANGEPTGQVEDVSHASIEHMPLGGMPTAHVDMAPGILRMPQPKPESIMDRLDREIGALEHEILALEGKQRELKVLRAMKAAAIAESEAS